MPENIIRVGLIGAGGNTTKLHIPGLKKQAGVEIVAVANRTRASGQRVASEFGIAKVCDDWRALLDAALIGCCQAVEHYEIARYGTLREWARALGNHEAHDLLTQILDQEKAANHKLTHMAVESINQP